MRAAVPVACALGGLVMLPSPACEAASGRIPALVWRERSDWFNVKTDVDPPARGDGIADDTAAIQKALDLLSDSNDRLTSLRNRVVYFPPGTYRITGTLSVARSHGAWLVGHGRDTVLAWDGPDGGTMYWSNGCTYARYEGLTWDGRGRAAVGVEHRSMHYYETSIRHQHCAFLNMKEHGVLVGRGTEKIPSAELWFNNCLFRSCGAGVSLLNFNDYDNTFDGCEFVDCGYGVNSVRGNFYLRASRFVRSRAADVRQVHASHASSIRLCTSQGSRRFFETGSGMHLAMKIQDCRVDGWTAPDGAVVLAHRGPTTIFDCVFSDPPGRAPPIRLANPGSVQQLLILSNNASPRTRRLVDEGPNSRITEVPRPGRRPALSDPGRRFLKDAVRAPGRVFDARRDFGARGDGTGDDTDAIQRCIDAARARGGNAVAYLPGGQYRVTSTLRVEGAGYRVSGTGFHCILRWDGAAGGTMMQVRNPRGIAVEHLSMEGPEDTARIRHRVDEGVTSTAFYDGVYVSGIGNYPVAGLWCEDLPAGATVLIGHLIGRIRLTDCGRATILCAQHYYSLDVEGAKLPKTGICGFMFHNDACHNYALDVKDNQDIIVADFYSETNKRYLLCEGGSRRGAGRVTIGASKVSPLERECVTIRNYEGRVFIGGGDGWWQSDMSQPVELVHEGDRPVYFIVAGQSWWGREPVRRFGPGMRYVGVENLLMENKYPEYGEKSLPNEIPRGGMEALAGALDDFRELAAAYLKAFFAPRRVTERREASGARTASPPPPRRRRPKSEALVQWDGRLLARVREELADGRRPRFSVTAFQQQFEILSVDEADTMGLRSPATEVDMEWSRLEVTDRRNLALAVLREGSQADHCLAAFYLIAAGEEKEAQEHLDKAGEAAGAVETAFEAASPGQRSRPDRAAAERPVGTPSESQAPDEPLKRGTEWGERTEPRRRALREVPPAEEGLPAPKIGPAGTLYREAETCFVEGDVGRAKELFEEITREHPESEYAPKAREYLEILE